MSIYKNCLKKVLMFRGEMVDNLKDNLCVSKRTAQRIIGGKREITETEAEAIKNFINSHIESIKKLSNGL